MTDPILLAHDGARGRVTAEIDADAGGRIAQIAVGDRELLVDPGDRDPASTGWGSYPMAPWAGRVRHGHFKLFGEERELELNRQDGPGTDPHRRHAMHGTVFTRPWTIDSVGENAVTLHCPLTSSELPTESLRNFGWTFGGTAHQTIELLEGQLCCHLSIDVDHDTQLPFLGEIGWHPWFRKPARLSFHPDAMYARDDIGLPTGELVEPSRGPWDDCFVNTAPITLHYDTAPAATPADDHPFTLTLSSDCDHWVVYDEPEHATCVEPQSGPPDAFNIRPRLVTHTHPLRRTMNIAW